MHFIPYFLIVELLQMWFYEVIGFNAQLLSFKGESIGGFYLMYRW